MEEENNQFQYLLSMKQKEIEELEFKVVSSIVDTKNHGAQTDGKAAD